jgi:hypothetical protein
MKIKLLFILLLIGFTTKAQDSTSVEKSVCIPVSVAKQIQLDLIEKDSTASMLEYALLEGNILHKKLAEKDTMISNYARNTFDLAAQLNNEKALKLSYKGIAEDCKTNYDKLGKQFSFYKKKTTFGGILLGGISLGLLSIIFVKL